MAEKLVQIVSISKQVLGTETALRNTLQMFAILPEKISEVDFSQLEIEADIFDAFIKCLTGLQVLDLSYNKEIKENGQIPS